MKTFYIVEVTGKNINRFVNKLFGLGINIYNIDYIENGILIKILKDDYCKLKHIKTIYSFNILKVFGKKRLENLVFVYRFFLIFFLLSLLCIVFLSRVVFTISINTDNDDVKYLINKELNDSGLTIYSVKKDYNSLQKIALGIKEKYKDYIEWIEISSFGVEYRVNVILREKDDNVRDNTFNDIIALENGYIRDMYIFSGDILRNKGDYVSKGDVIVSGTIKKGDIVTGYSSSSGIVYAEVWKIIKINAPFFYNDEVIDSYTRIIDINVFGKQMVLFKYKSKSFKNRVLYNGLFGKLEVRTVSNIREDNKVYSEYELQNLLENMAREKMEGLLKEKEYIILQKTLKKSVDSDKMYLEVFFKVYENIALKKDIKSN